MSDYNLTLFEACEYLNRSKKSLSRYIRQGLLNPKKIRSKQGTLEYRFNKEDLDAFKTQDTADKERQNGQTEKTPIIEAKTKAETDEDRQAKTDQTSQDNEIISLLKETTGLLKEQLETKDGQIKDLSGKIDELIQRNRETNILIGQLQSKVLMLEQPKETIINEIKETKTGDKTGQDETDQDGTGQDKTKQDSQPKEKKIKQDKQQTETKPKEKKGFWQKLFK